MGTVVALIYMVLDFFLSRGREDTHGTDRPDSAGSILANILKIAVPITLSSSMVGIVTVIDSSLVQGQLQSALNLTEKASRTLYGNYSGALNIYNLPTSLMAAITASVIPAVSAALARRDRRGAARITGSAPAHHRPAVLPHGGGPVRAGHPHHPPAVPQPECGGGRTPAVHPGRGNPLCVHGAGVQLCFTGPRLYQPARHRHGAGGHREDREQL